MIRTIVGYAFLACQMATVIYLIDIGLMREWVLTPIALANAVSTVFLSRPPTIIQG